LSNAKWESMECRARVWHDRGSASKGNEIKRNHDDPPDVIQRELAAGNQRLLQMDLKELLQLIERLRMDARNLCCLLKRVWMNTRGSGCSLEYWRVETMELCCSLELSRGDIKESCVLS
jgi:hypothetical protein